jgi:hypothetical protein
MQRYLVETYLPRARGGELQELMSAARLAVEDLRADGLPVRYVRATFLPTDETCFHLFEAASVATVEEAARRAGFATHRIVEAIEWNGRRRPHAHGMEPGRAVEPVPLGQEAP